jgi:hypothetical protein
MGNPIMSLLFGSQAASALAPPWQNSYAQPDWQNRLTKLDPEEEAQFQKWANQAKAPITPDYDMRGYWKSGDYQKGTSINKNDNLPHYNDRWKTPLHQSFSGESVYSLPGGPSWNKRDQLVDKNGNILFDERKHKGK